MSKTKVDQVQDHYETAFGDCLVTVTEWQNGEGFDAETEMGNRHQKMAFAWSEWAALQHAVLTLRTEIRDE